MTLSPTSDTALDVVRQIIEAGSGVPTYRGYEVASDLGDALHATAYISITEHLGGEDIVGAAHRRTGMITVIADWYNEGALTAAERFRAWSSSMRGRDLMARLRMPVQSISSVVNLTERNAGVYRSRAQCSIIFSYTEILEDALPTTSIADIDVHDGSRTERVTITGG